MCQKQEFDSGKFIDDLEEARSGLRERGMGKLIILALDFTDPDAAVPTIAIKIASQAQDLDNEKQIQVCIEADQIANMLNAKGWHVRK